MTETYSLSTKGVLAGTPYTLTNTILPDSSARAGSEANAMQLGSQIYCKNPDGSFGWYTIDAERSIPGQTPVLKAVSP